MSSAMDAEDSHDCVLLSHERPADWVSPTPRPCYDLVVIGVGTAGLVAMGGSRDVGRLLRGWLAWRRPARGV
jgi:hypothetical protein